MGCYMPLTLIQKVLARVRGLCLVTTLKGQGAWKSVTKISPLSLSPLAPEAWHGNVSLHKFKKNFRSVAFHTTSSSRPTPSSPTRLSQATHQSRCGICPPSEPKQRNPPNPQIQIRIVVKRVGCVLGIEPNEHQFQRFQEKTAIILNCLKTSETL